MSEKTASSSNKKLWLSLLGVLAFTGVCFLPSLRNDWVNWDDPTYVLSNPLVISDTIQWRAIFEKDQLLGIYHPLTLLSYAIDYQLWGTNAFGYHLTNLVFHICNTALVFILVRKLNTSIFVSVVVSILFGIHPMHVESVAWISERKDVLYVFFLLLAWISYLNFSIPHQRKRILWYLLMILLFGCSVLSKPIAFVFPVILLLSDYLNKQSFLHSFRNKIPVFVIAIAALFVAQWGQLDSGSIGTDNLHPVSTLFYGTYNVSFYLFKAFIPLKLSIFHPFPLDNTMNTLLYLSVISFIAFLSLLYWSFKKSRQIFFGLLFFFLTISPLLQIIPFGKALSSERYTYLPYLGLFYALAIGLELLIQRITFSKKIILPLCTLPALLLGSLTYQQQNVWKSSEVLWSSVIKNYPNGYWGYLARGRYYQEQQNQELALADFNKSIALSPSAEALYERGRIFEKNGNIERALSDYLGSINCLSTYVKSHNNASGVYARKGNYERAFYHIEQAIKFDNNYSLAYLNQAILYKTQGNGAEALTSIQNALILEPNNLRYVEIRAAIYTDLGNQLKAITDFLHVIEKAPQNAIAYYYLGLNYGAIDQLELAQKYLRRSQELGYSLPKNIQESYSL